MWKTEEVTKETFHMVMEMFDWRVMAHNTSLIYVEHKSGRWLGEKKQDGTYHLAEGIAPLQE